MYIYIYIIYITISLQSDKHLGNKNCKFRKGKISLFVSMYIDSIVFSAPTLLNDY